MLQNQENKYKESPEVSQRVELLLVVDMKRRSALCQDLLATNVELLTRVVLELLELHAVGVRRVLLEVRGSAQEQLVLVLLIVALHARLARQELIELLLLQVLDRLGREHLARLLARRRKQIHGQLRLVAHLQIGVALVHRVRALLFDLALILELNVAPVKVAFHLIVLNY